MATLTKLTSLFVSAKPDVQHDRLPASFTALVHLRRLAWCCTHQPLDPRLPGGAWLAHLDTLVLPAAAAAGSLEVLNGAGQLAMVGVQRQILLQHRGGAEAVAAVVAWAAPRPALRRVVIDYPSSESVPTALAAVRAHPKLRIERGFCELGRVADGFPRLNPCSCMRWVPAGPAVVIVVAIPPPLTFPLHLTNLHVPAHPLLRGN